MRSRAHRPRQTDGRPLPSGRLLLLSLALLGAPTGVGAEPARDSDDAAAQAPSAPAPTNPCADAETLATGSADPAIFAREASRGVQAFWCETYDADGRAQRAGAYWDVHPGGATRVRARYVAGRIEGPVEVFDADGQLWLRGVLTDGAWSGDLELFHANGARWLSASFRDGQLDGPVETRFPDGRLESRTHFQAGREDGLATSYYPAQAGGGVRTQVRVEGDEIVDAAPARPADSSLSQADRPAPVGAPGAPLPAAPTR